MRMGGGAGFIENNAAQASQLELSLFDGLVYHSHNLLSILC